MEQPRQHLRVDADAGVLHAHRQAKPIALAFEHGGLDPDIASLGELDRVTGQVEQHVAQLVGITHELALRGAEIGGRQDQRQPLVARQRTHDVVEIVEQHAQLEGLLHQVDAARFDACQVEDVVDLTEQRAAGRFNGRQQLALLLVQGGVPEHVAHADDRVDRGADLVAHIGQEPALGLIGLLGRQPGVAQFGHVEQPDQRGGGSFVLDGHVGGHRPEGGHLGLIGLAQLHQFVADRLALFQPLLDGLESGLIDMAVPQ